MFLLGEDLSNAACRIALVHREVFCLDFFWSSCCVLFTVNVVHGFKGITVAGRAAPVTLETATKLV